MNNSAIARLNEIIQRIPLLIDYRIEDFEVIQLAGLSNKNYRIKNEEYDLILRIPRQTTNFFISREAETNNQSIAIDLGLSPICLWHRDNGESLTQTIKNSRSLTASDLKKPAIIKLISQKLRRLHGSQQQFQGQVNLPELLKQYFTMLSPERQQVFKSRYDQALSKLQTMDLTHSPLVPSHNDLNENNLLLDDHNKLWLIDWEYSSMASPYWDMASICNAGSYELTHCTSLLNSYNTDDYQLELCQLQDYREILSVLNACWTSVFTLEKRNIPDRDLV